MEKPLAVKRWGPAGEHIHMEDFAQVFGLYPDDKHGYRRYANIAWCCDLKAGEVGTYEFLQRIGFAHRNADMHLTNWSLVLSSAFADTAPLPASPLWPIVTETAERTVAAWGKLPEEDLLGGKRSSVLQDQSGGPTVDF